MSHSRRFEADVARQLVLEHGPQKALRLTIGGRMKAKRARSRKEFQSWAAVASEIESLSNESLNGAGATVRIEHVDALNAK
jgi:hypothetical protein